MTRRAARSRSLLLVLCLAVFAALVSGAASYRIATSRITDTLDKSLILTRRSIETEIDRFRYLPRIAAEDIRIRQAIANPRNAATIAEANRYLATVAEESGADHLYLLDAAGTAIAASNWQAPDSFVGKDYGFRPYFTNAMRDGTGRFYAIGVTTGQPGYFLSTRVTSDGRDRAVMVVKVDLAPLQAAWRSAAVETAIADADGIVFLSGQPDWLYQPLFALSPAALDRLTRTRRYEGVPIADARPLIAGGSAALDATRPVTVLGHSLLVRRLQMAPDDWQVILASPVAGAWNIALAVAAISALATMAAALLMQTMAQRRRMIGMRLQQGRLLEQQVARRTQELAAEIETRITAERDLRQAQDALIQSEKMAALGRMSTAIVHEISQPLAAMEATLAAAAIAGRSGGGDPGPRIETARGHVRRMLRTIKHLKSFGRKDSGEVSVIDIDQAIANALDLVRPRARDMKVTLDFDRDGGAPLVLGGLVRLEQVVVNLLLNALDAVSGMDGRGRVCVTRIVAADRVRVDVVDNGVGLDAASLGKLGEPFFSQSRGGDGLGLGVSISQTIVEGFNGTLTYTSVTGAGTTARVSLPLASPDAQKTCAA